MQERLERVEGWRKGVIAGGGGGGGAFKNRQWEELGDRAEKGLTCFILWNSNRNFLTSWSLWKVGGGWWRWGCVGEGEHSV